MDGGLRTNLKGRLNFSTLGTGPGHIITLSDSNFQKTIATANNRPTNDANDAFIGYDQGDGNPAHIGISVGAPLSISNYIANVGDGTSWLERLTSTLKEFKTNVQMDGTLTVAGVGSGRIVCLHSDAGAVHRQFCHRHPGEWRCQLQHRGRHPDRGDNTAHRHCELWTVLV